MTKESDFRVQPAALTRAMREAARERPSAPISRAVTGTERLQTVNRAFQVSVAVKKHHNKNAQLWVSQRYATLLKKEGSQPALRPSWAMDDPRARLKRQAELGVAHKLAKRLERVEQASKRMLGKTADRERGLGE
jgi:hypothetical protein